MRIPVLRPAVLRAALLALPLGLLPARATAQLSCTTRTECVEKGIPFTNQDPGLTFRSLPDTVYEARQEVAVFAYDGWGLDEYSRRFTISGGTLLIGPTWRWNKPVASGWMTATVQLASGPNVLTARVCDLTDRCTERTRQVVYQVPPPAPGRVAPVVRNALDLARRAAATCDGCSDAVLAYSTPVYVSLDQPRGVTLMYARSKAAPQGYAEVEVAEHSPEAPVRMSIQVMHPGGNAVTPEIFYQGGGGARTMAVQWDASSYGTSALVHTAVVRSYWNDGPPLQATVPVRVIVIDERQSRFGAGWSMVGLQRLHVQSDGVLLTHGDGSAVFFARLGNAYQSPAGEVSTLSYDDLGSQYTRLYPDGSQAVFGGDGYLYRSADRFGNLTSYQWISNYQGVPVPHRITDPAGQGTVMEYHTAVGPHYGKLASITDPGGRRTYFGYWDGGENLTVVQDVTGGTGLLVDYEVSAHVLTAWRDRRGGVWNVSYDHAGRLAELLGPAVTDGGETARETTTIRSRHAAMLPLPGTGTIGVLARRVTVDSGTVVIASASDSVRIWADARGLATRVAGRGYTTTIRRNGNGQVRSVDDGKGNAVSFDYQLARPYAVTEMRVVGADGGGMWTYAYGPYAALARVVEAGGDVTDHVIDALGRRTATVLGGDTIAWYTYDGGGRLLTATDAQRHTVTYAYQPGGTRNLATVTADGVAIEHRYDALGRGVRSVWAGTAGDSVSYDSLNRVTSVTASLGTTRFGFGVNGVDLDDVVDPLGQRYQFRHNVVGWVTTEIDPAGRQDVYGYNPATGTLRTATTRRGNTIAFTYDDQRRPLQRTADGATTTWRYDPDARWAVAVNAASYDSINYDSEGKVTRTVTRRGALEFSTHHTYDEANRPDSVIVAGPWGSSASVYLYDPSGRMDGIRDPTGRWTELFFNKEGMVDSLRLPTVDTARTLFRYTPRHQLSSTLSETPNQSRQYAYSPLGLTLRDSISGGTVGWEHQYGYDALNRVKRWELHKFGQKRVCYDGRDCTMVDTDSLAQWLSFAWDAVGNPTGATRDPGNRVRAHGGYSYDYDLDGNLTRKYNASGFDQTFAWNALGQLTGTTRTGVGSATYQYDGLGRRIQRQDHTGAVTHYVYDGDDLVLEVDGAGNRIREYTYFPGIDRPHSMRQWANGEGGAIYYYQMQKPGHVSGLVNTSNQLVNDYRYTPFGTPVDGYPVQGTPNPLQYMARELDGLSGLYYVRNRWYDPQQGRFVSEDPIGLAGGINQYAYVGNKPMSLRDPWGLAGNCAYGRLPTTDPHYDGGAWTFIHNGVDWTGVAIGGVVILCPGPPPQSGFGGAAAGRRGGGGAGQGMDRPRTRFCRRSPLAPDGVDLAQNLVFAEWARGNVPLPMRLRLFYDLVNYDSPWDFKTGGEQYEPFGNWHYGATGSAMGFGPQLLLRAAGWAQERQNQSDPEWGHFWYLDGGPYGDQPSDNRNIRRGISAYNTGCTG